MGLFGFGKKKKTEEEIVAEGRDYYLNGDNKHAYLTLHGIAHKGQNAEACYYYGLVRLEGIRQPEVPANEEEGMKYIRKAAELGHAKAFELYARMNMSEPAPASKAASAQEPVSATKTASVPEPVPAPAPAQKTDDDLYNEGVEAYGEKNYAIAVQTWLPLAEKGMAPAQESMGLLYYRGDGVEKDEKKAAEWYRKAAEQGRGRACFNLAIFYERGIGVEKDLTEALRWAEKAKEAGYEKSGDLIAEVRFWLEKEENQKKASDAQTYEELTSEEKYMRGMELFKAGDYEGAFSMLRKVCRAIGAQKGKYPDGQAAMGWMYEHGQGVEAKDGMAQMHYRIAARNGDRDGMAGVVRLTAKAESPGVSECETALKYVNQLGTEEAKAFLNALEQKMAEAQKREAEETERKQREEELERTFDEGMKAYENKDYARALYCFEKAAEQGSDAAQYNCGLLYEHGEGTAVDESKALMWYEKAAEQGHSDAQFFCGCMYDEGRGTAADKVKALYWYEKAAEQGNAAAQYNCGLMYGRGEGTAVDQQKARYWFEKAAEQGDALAQYCCGCIYDEGTGTAVDKVKALYWFEKAAEQGNAAAQYNCGLMYFKGEGTTVNKTKTLMWLEKSAKQGLESAYFPCAEAHFCIDGAVDYLQKALKWYDKAGTVEDENAEIAISKAETIRTIISAIQQVQAGTSKIDRQISNMLNLSNTERKEILDSYTELSMNQQIAVRHFVSIRTLTNLKNMEKEEDRKIMADTMEHLRRGMITDLVMSDLLH